MRIDPNTAIIKVEELGVVIDEIGEYLALNKPKGWQSAMSDEQGRPCIGDLVSERVMARSAAVPHHPDASTPTPRG